MPETAQDILSFEPGLVIAGHYEVLRCLGIGRTGTVYLCRALTESPYLLALKVLSSAFVKGDHPFYARFKNEIAATYRVSHRNVVFTYEYISEPDLVAYTMEYVSGGTLSALIESYQSLSMPQIIEILRQICAGLEAIHQAGIIHRDLKPDNILLTERGEVKITDFGIALTGDGPKLTAKGSVVGTIQYLSPEYLEKGSVSEQGDIYAVGTIAYELLTGHTPYQDKSVFQTIDLKINADPIPPHELNPLCPPQLSDLVMRALHRDSKQRFRTAAEFGSALLGLADDLGLREYAPLSPVAHMKVSTEGNLDLPPWIAQPTEIYRIHPAEVLAVSSVRSHRTPWLVGISGVLCGVLLLAAGTWWHSERKERAEEVYVPLLEETLEHVDEPRSRLALPSSHGTGSPFEFGNWESTTRNGGQKRCEGSPHRLNPYCSNDPSLGSALSCTWSDD